MELDRRKLTNNDINRHRPICLIRHDIPLSCFRKQGNSFNHLLKFRNYGSKVQIDREKELG